MYKFPVIQSLLFLMILSACGLPTNGTRISTEGAISVSFLSSAKINKDNAEISKRDRPYRPGDKLVAVDWGQSYPYNGQLELPQGGSPVAGCLPVALAQLSYHHRPEFIRQTIMKHNLLAPNGELRYGNYLWDEIEKYEVNKGHLGMLEVQRMVRDIGLTMDTTYSPHLNSSSTQLNKLPQFLNGFGFKKTTTKTYVNATLNAMEEFEFSLPPEAQQEIINSIDKFEPILLSMSGRKMLLDNNFNSSQVSVNNYHDENNSSSFEHAVLIDGYKFDNSGIFLVHINWGWGGRSNGFFPLEGGLKLLLEEKNKKHLVYIPSIILYTNLTSCKNDLECPVVSNEVLNTTYNQQSGQVTGPSSANHFKKKLAVLKIDEEVMIRNNSGFFQLQFKNIDTRKVVSYNFLQSGNFNIVLSGFTPGTYEVILDSIQVIDRDLNSIPLRFTITSKSGSVLPLVEIKENNTTVTGMDISNTQPLVLPFAADYALPIKIAFPKSDMDYEILIDQESSVRLVENYLISQEMKIDGKRDEIELTLLGKNKNTGETQIIEVKKINLIRSNKDLQVVNPSASFSGQFHPNKKTSFYFIGAGNCEISGSRGYSNQAFFYSITAQNDRLSHTDISKTTKFKFAPGIYKISASLSSNRSAFNYDNNLNFRLNIQCDQQLDALDVEAFLTQFK
jgi:hypothetical protein